MSKKNIVALFLVIFFLINIIAVVIPVFVRADDGIKIYYNDKELVADVSPVIFNDRTLVPVRMIFEAIKADVNWDEKTKKVTIVTENDDTFKFTINSDIAYINSKKFQLDTAAKIISSRTFIPLRFLAENSGLDVSWSDKERSVYLKDKKEENKNNEKVQYNYILDIENDETSIDITLKNEKAEYDSFVLEDPQRLVIDIKNCIKDINKELKAKGKYYKAARYSQFDTDPMVSRLVIELCDNVEYTVYTKGKELSIEFFLEGEEPAREDTENVKGEDVVYKEPKVNKKYKTVVLDPGHGGTDPGALGMDGKKIILKEKDVNLEIALRVYNKLKNEKLNVFMTRSEDEFLELSEIVDFANSKNADLFVSIHNNAADNTDLSGTMVMYANDEPKEGYDLSGEDFAKVMQKHLVKATKGHDFGPRKNSALYVVRKTNMPAVITESLFITNEDDRKKLMDEEYIEKIAVAIYEGICEVIDSLEELEKED